jgi:hypothetical protein
MGKHLKKGAGGKRPGSGQPKKEPTTVLSFRVEKEGSIELKNELLKVIKNKKATHC